jgi:lysyl-tRNA synthetase, class II
MLHGVGASELTTVRSRQTQRPEQAALRWRPWVPVIVAWVVRLTALATIAGLLLPETRVRYESRVGDALGDGVIFATVIAAAGLQLVLAGALRRRKRRAWWLMVVVVTVGILAHAAAMSHLALVVNLVLLALLLWGRRDFTARAEPGTRWAALRVLVVMACVSLAAGLLLTTHTAPRSPLSDRLSETIFGLVGFAPNLRFDQDGFSTLTEVALTSMGAVTALVTVLVLLTPARKRAGLTVGDEQCLRDLLARHGQHDSLGYFALRRDKVAVFSHSGKAAVAHRVVSGVSLASGDPLGDPEAWPGAIEAWLAEADSYAWIPGVIGCSEAGANAYVRAGLDGLEIGDEAVLCLDDFSLEGRAMRGVRQAVRRVERSGYTLTIARQRDLDDATLQEAIDAAEQFRDGDVERGFSMALGRIGNPADPDVVLALARDCDARMMAVLCFVPWGDDGLSLDVMRRARDSENGTVEFVVAGVAARARELGVRRVSLNFAVFRSAFDRGSRVGAGPVLRVWRQVLLVASRWWQIESLYRANAKYNPVWVPRFVCFRRASELPRVTLAALEAEAFLVRPRLFRRYS